MQCGISFFTIGKSLNQHLKGEHMNSLNREREIVLALAEGLSNKDIGRKLNLSEGSVKVHLHNIYRKLGVKNRTALAVLAFTGCRAGKAASFCCELELRNDGVGIRLAGPPAPTWRRDHFCPMPGSVG